MPKAGFISRTQSQFARLIELDRQIRAGRYPNGVSFAREWEVSEKTIRRDFAYLRERLNAPLAYDRKHCGYYYSDPSWHVPALSVSEEDIWALMVSSSAARLFSGAPVAHKLQQVTARLLGTYAGHPAALITDGSFTGLSFTSSNQRTIDPATWLVVFKGMVETRVVSAVIAKGAYDDRSGRYVFEPLHIASIQGDWYVFVRMVCDDAVEQIPLARLSQAECLKNTFRPRHEIDFKAAVENMFGRHVYFRGEPSHPVKLLFCPELASVVQERIYALGQRLICMPDGSVEMTFATQSLVEVLWWVLGWGHGVRVLEPVTLIDLHVQEIEKMKGLYQGRKPPCLEQQKVLHELYRQTEARL